MNEKLLCSKDWLTASDLQLCRMVESLMQKTITPRKAGRGFYFLVIPYNGKGPEYLSAVIDAIRGRAGERFSEVQDIPESERMKVYIKVAENGN